jgi:hypothetical protein
MDACCDFSDQTRLRLSCEVDECKPLDAGGYCPFKNAEKQAGAHTRSHFSST